TAGLGSARLTESGVERRSVEILLQAPSAAAAAESGDGSVVIDAVNRKLLELRKRQTRTTLLRRPVDPIIMPSTYGEGLWHDTGRAAGGVAGTGRCLPRQRHERAQLVRRAGDQGAPAALLAPPAGLRRHARAAVDPGDPQRRRAVGRGPRVGDPYRPGHHEVGPGFDRTLLADVVRVLTHC